MPNGDRSTSERELGRIIMERPYRDVLVWLGGIRPPDSRLPTDRAIAAVVRMLAAYDRDSRLAARWEARFAEGRSNALPFGLNPAHRKILRAYLTE